MNHWMGRLVFVAALVVTGSVRADVTVFNSQDAGAGPLDAHPNTDAAATAFNTTAGSLGTGLSFNFEGLPLGAPGNNNPLTVAPGVTLTLQNTSPSTIPNFPFGISNNSPNPVLDGYNTTLGGSQYLEFVPQLGASSASLTFQFAQPISAFGANLTGVGTAPGDLHLLFNDGAAHDLLVSGSSLGGIQFLGFTDPGASISSITLQMNNVPTTTRDVFGVDDVRFVPVPEPAACVQLALGGMGLIAGGLWSRREPRGDR